MVQVEFMTNVNLEDLQNDVNTFLSLIQASEGSILAVQFINGAEFIASITYIEAPLIML